MDQSDTIGMNRNQSIELNATQSVGAVKITSVIGDTSMFIKGKLTEMIEGDVTSEVKQGKTVVNSDQGVETTSNISISKHTQKEVQNNSGE
ncbi:hypothetical protein [Chryseobacterium indoltheticum]|uniref:hypothetical protein n=1 Tax=Chryseobacterium indoltheticum TaxID=254 RepID=UPI0019135165|nr:hypothetical protein [Chryseobacterium indoltheticum]QQQ27978.1 hypothetical protein JJL46_18140 [Chryseobacterium indoltheticum]